jgi:hypothetical protein
MSRSDRMEKLVMTDGLAKSINDQIRDDVCVKGAIAMRNIGGVQFLEGAIPGHLLAALMAAEGQLERAADATAHKRATDDLKLVRDELLLWAAPTLAAKLAPRRMIGR